MNTRTSLFAKVSLSFLLLSSLSTRLHGVMEAGSKHDIVRNMLHKAIRYAVLFNDDLLYGDPVEAYDRLSSIKWHIDDFFPPEKKKKRKNTTAKRCWTM